MSRGRGVDILPWPLTLTIASGKTCITGNGGVLRSTSSSSGPVSISLSHSRSC